MNVKNNKLFVGGISAEGMAGKFGTPVCACRANGNPEITRISGEEEVAGGK